MRLRTLTRVGLVAAALFAYLSVGLSSAVAATCDSLAALTLPNTRVLSAQAQPAGRFTPAGAGPGAQNPAPNPALGRARGTAARGRGGGILSVRGLQRPG